MLKNKILIILVFICLIAAALLAFLPDGEKSTDSIEHEEAAKSSLTGKAVIPVMVDTAFSGTLIKHIQTGGTAEAARETPVIFEKGGYVSEVNVIEGQRVKKGALLVRLSNEQEEIAFSEARSALVKSLVDFGVQAGNTDSAAVYLERMMDSKYRKQDVGRLFLNILKGENRDEVRMVTSGLTDAWNAYRRAQLNYRRTFFYAPFAGIIGNVQIKKGKWLPAAQEAFRLYDLSKIKIIVDVLESEAPAVSKNAYAEIVFNSLPCKIYKGIIKEVNPVIDPEKRIMRAGIFVNNDGGIKPGMTAEVKIQTAALSDRLLVPKESILIRDNRELVFVVRDSIANWCYVQTGERNDRYVEIKSSEFNLIAGEPVIVDGHFSLAHGAGVEAKPVNGKQ